MSYTYLQGQEGASLVECSSDIPQFAQWKLNLTVEKSCSKDRATESCRASLFGTTSPLSTPPLGADRLTSCAEASPAKTFPVPEKEPELTASEADCGGKWPEWFAKWDRDSFSWKTRQPSLFEGLEESWLIWPRWGMMQDGECSALAEAESCITENASSFWPTPQRIDEDFCRMRIESASREGHQIHVTTELIKKHGKRFPLPNFGEALMGWPDGYSQAGKPLAMDKFQAWLREHGGH